MNRGFFLGGTSSILRTFRAGPVKKHPVCLIKRFLYLGLKKNILKMFSRNIISSQRFCISIILETVFEEGSHSIEVVLRHALQR